MRSERQIEGAKKSQFHRLGQSGASGKRKRCRKGKSCGASCISGSKFCMVDLPWVGKEIGKVRDEVQSGRGAASDSGKPPSFKPATPTSTPMTTRESVARQQAAGILAEFSGSTMRETNEADGILPASRLNWRAGLGEGSDFVASGSYGAFMAVPPENLGKGLKDKFPGGVGVKYGEVNAREVEVLKKAGEAGAGPRLIAAKVGVNEDYRDVGMLAMERLSGKTLAKTYLEDIGGGRLRVKDGDAGLERLSNDYLRGISALHKAGIEHGDAHLGNAILQPDGKVKFIDMGFAYLRPSAALSEAIRAVSEDQSPIYNVSSFRGPVADKLRGNYRRIESQIRDFQRNVESNPYVSAEDKNKAALKLINDLYEGI